MTPSWPRRRVAIGSYLNGSFYFLHIRQIISLQQACFCARNTSVPVRRLKWYENTPMAAPRLFIFPALLSNLFEVLFLPSFRPSCLLFLFPLGSDATSCLPDALCPKTLLGPLIHPSGRDWSNVPTFGIPQDSATQLE